LLGSWKVSGFCRLFAGILLGRWEVSGFCRLFVGTLLGSWRRGFLQFTLLRESLGRVAADVKVLASFTFFARALGVELAPPCFGVSFLVGRSFSFGFVGRLRFCGFVARVVDTTIVLTLAVFAISCFGLCPLTVFAFGLLIAFVLRFLGFCRFDRIWSLHKTYVNMMGGFIITSYARVECASVRRFGVTTQGTGGCSYVGCLFWCTEVITQRTKERFE
jgi:hypothetical protein